MPQVELRVDGQDVGHTKLCRLSGAGSPRIFEGFLRQRQGAYMPWGRRPAHRGRMWLRACRSVPDCLTACVLACRRRLFWELRGFYVCAAQRGRWPGSAGGKV